MHVMYDARHCGEIPLWVSCEWRLHLLAMEHMGVGPIQPAHSWVLNTSQLPFHKVVHPY